MPNYRQQTSGSLLAQATCASCFSQLILCYAATADDLCCGTSIQKTVFAAGTGITTLAAVTGLLYDTNALQTPAVDGFYSDDAGISCTTQP